MKNGSKSSTSSSSTSSTKPHRFIATRRHRSLYVIPKQRPVIRENIFELETFNGGTENSISATNIITGSEKTIDNLSSDTSDLPTNNEIIVVKNNNNKSNQNDVS